MRQSEKWMEVDAPVEQVFALFSGLHHFPQWMSGVQQVELLAPRRTRWTALTAAGQSVAWEAETTVFELNRRLAWRAVTGPVAREFDATFETTARGTALIRAVFNEDEAASAEVDGPGSFTARLEADLTRFKLMAEREAQGSVPPRPDTDAPAAARSAVRADKVAQPLPPAEELPTIQTPRGARPLATSQELELAARPDHSASRRVEVDLRAPRQPAESARRNVVPLNPQRPAATQTTTRRRPVRAGYLLLGALLALLLGAAWFLTNYQPSRSAEVQTSTPASTAIPSEPTAADSSAVARENATDSGATRDARPTTLVTEPATTTRSAAAVDARTSVIGAINEWVAATNARDIKREMSFYAPVVQRYYRQSYVSRDAVRADKQQRLGAANAVRVRVDEPQITWEKGGRVANVRFRKQYEIKSRGRVERGAVLQQLFLSQGDRQWQIFSERDLRVLR